MRTRSATMLIVVFLLTGLSAVVVHAFVPTGPVGDVSYLLAVFIAAAIGIVGTLRRPRGTRLVAGLLTAGLAASALGDLISSIYGWVGDVPAVSLADPLYLCGYLGLVAATTVMTMVRRDDRLRADPGAIIDALTVVIVSLLVLWSLAVDGFRAAVTSPSAQGVGTAYAVADALLLAMSIRVVAQRRTRDDLGLAFMAGVLCWLSADIAYYVVGSALTTSVWMDLGWMLGAPLMALATVRHQLVPTDTDYLASQSPQKIMLFSSIPLLVPPGVLLISVLWGSRIHAFEAVAGMTLLAALSYARTARLLRSMEASRDAALAGSRAKSEFLATMSHEIRTPMNGVIGLTSLLLDSDLDTRQRQYAEGVQAAGNGLLAVISDILDFSKIEAGHLELEDIDFDLRQLVDDVAALVGESARSKGLGLHTHCSSDVPATVSGDPARIRQVLLNLVGNAVKFTATGEVSIRVFAESTTGDPAFRFEIVDTGIGIEPATRDRLFEPFSQADSSTTRRYGGTGLGLAISHQLVTAMGGRIGVDSVPGRGSTFWFTVPLSVIAPAPAPVPVRTAPAEPDAEAAPTGRGRILLVEDGDINQLVATGILEHLDYTVEIAEDGLVALRKLERSAFDAVLMDVQMPNMDGLQATAEFRRLEPAGRRTPIIAMTAGAFAGDRDACLAAGMDDYLAKPIDVAGLGAMLERWVPAGDRLLADPCAFPHRDPRSSPPFERPMNPC